MIDDSHNIHEFILDTNDQKPLIQLNFQECKQIFIEIMKNAIPTAASMFFTILIFNINIYFIGNLNIPVLLGAIGYANTYINVFGTFIIYALNNGLLTLSSQAFGKKDYYLCGILYQRGLIINLLVCIIPILLFVSFKNFQDILSINHEIIEPAYTYIIVNIPGVVFYAYYDVTKNMLISQQVYNVQLYIQSLSCIIHIMNLLIFVTFFELEILGAAIATNLTLFINSFLLFMYIKKYKPCHKDSMGPWDSRALQDWIPFLKVSIIMGLSIYLDTFLYELMSVFAGWLTVADLATHVAMTNSYAILLCLAIGQSSILNNMVGNAMGSSQINKAKNIASIGYISTMAITFIIFIMLNIFKKEWSEFFTSDPEINKLIMSFALLFLFCSLGDASQMMLCGIMKGCALENQAVKIMFPSYYLFGVPIGYITCFHMEMGLKGIWLGFFFAMIMATSLEFYVLININWKAQSDFIRNRLNQSNDENYIEI